jgi:predicted nucleic-acid-binding Zn-ribbon protein
MRKQHVCPKCRHNHILLIENVADAGEFSTELRPLHVAIAFKGISFFGNEQLVSAGRLTAAVCKQCGYTELYTAAPALIPVDGKYVREVVGPEPAPYR